MWDFSATFAFCMKANGLATFFIAPKNCIFWSAPFEPKKKVASLFAQKLQGFNGKALYHCYTLECIKCVAVCCSVSSASCLSTVLQSVKCVAVCQVCCSV